MKIGKLRTQSVARTAGLLMRDLLSVLRDRRNWLLVVGVFISAGTVILEIVVGLSSAVLISVAVAILGMLAAGLLTERLEYFKKIEDTLNILVAREGDDIACFYANRARLPKFESVVDRVESELFWVGNAGGYLMAAHLRELEEKAQDGSSVRLLLMCPKIQGNPNPLVPIFGDVTDNFKFNAVLEANIFSLARVRQRFLTRQPEVAGRFQVRLYETLVTMVLTFVDAQLPSGTINVELIPYRFGGSQRPSFDLKVGNASELCRRLYERYNELWAKSVAIEDYASSSESMGRSSD